MNNDNIVVDLRLSLNRKNGRIEVSILSESEHEAANVALSSFFRMRENSQRPLQEMAVKSAKTDPNLKSGARLRPMWTKTTCDIIK